MKIRKLVTTISLIIVLSCGCGKTENDPDAALSTYHAGITSFNSDIAELSSRMDAIDITAEDAPTTLLICLDEMNAHFTELSELSVPDRYNGAKGLAVQASQSMSEAVDLYHQLYSAERFDAELSQRAKLRYDEAMGFVDSIGALIMNYSE
ncbi:MAG: hypothetical protein K5686_10710 [Lachnospiraceae bacterium]|nr:hypothetical protein [Lachnospiraceae bacterium]